MNNKPRVLLTANYGPNELAKGEDMLELGASRLSKGHGPFNNQLYLHYFALYLIAENISNPTTVLENPHWDEFDRELDQGYEYVGFQLKSVHTKKIARMIKRIRDKSPDTKIVVGGYGVGTLGSPVPGDVNGDAVYIRENADYLCREEGVRFMRRILGDEPIDREITQYHLPTWSFGLPGVGLKARMPVVLGSLGCPNACDFCNTSAMFDNKKVYVAEPEQIHRFVKSYVKKLGNNNFYFALFDEDFFLNPDYVRELGRLLRKDKDTWGAKYFTFGSINSLSKFTPEEIRDSGAGIIWIGVESFQCGADKTDDHYAKRKGKEVKEIVDGLQKSGILTVGSLVLGFDFHTKENLKDDIDQFVALKPTFHQISHVLPCPGTPLYERLLEEDRILDNYKWEDLHFWSDDIFKYKNIKQSEVRQLYDYTHEQLRDENGPPILQMAECMLDGRKSLGSKGDDDEYRASQVEYYSMFAKFFSTYLRSIKLHHTSPGVRERAHMIEKRYQEEIGSPGLISRASSYYLSRSIRKKKQIERPTVVSDPPPRWSYYNTFDDRIWVKRGRKAKKPAPDKDRGFITR